MDCWRLMKANEEAIDMASDALIAQGELVGDEITGLLDSVGLRMQSDADPYPPALPKIPNLEAEERRRIEGGGRQEKSA